jgi:GNAT superfamily N-acetyltransferase
MTEIRSRTATFGDREALIDLIQELNVYESAITGDRLVTRGPAEDYLRSLEQRIAASQGRLLVAVSGKEIVGLLAFVIETDQVYVHADVRRYGMVADLVIAEPWRKRGIGRFLLTEAEHLTRDAGLHRMMIGVLAGNDPALRAYHGFGFRDYAQILVKSL